jgi:hypothetical protein
MLYYLNIGSYVNYHHVKFELQTQLVSREKIKLGVHCANKLFEKINRAKILFRG